MTIGENIKMVRKAKKLTQKQVGEACDPKMAQSTVRQYELGKRNPKPVTVQKIAKALDVPLRILYQGVENIDFTDPIIENDRDIAYDKFEAHFFDTILKNHKTVEVVNYTKENVDPHVDAYVERQKLNTYFGKLNIEGKKEAVRQIEKLTKIPEYKKEPDSDNTDGLRVYGKTPRTPK